MQQYPNYWMNNYPQQYPQPMYPNQQINQQFQQNQQMPYMDQLNQLRMQQVQPVQNQVQGLMGRLVDDFSVKVTYEQVENKNYSFSAGQYFEIKIVVTNLTQEEYEQKIHDYSTKLDELFSNGKALEDKIRKGVEGLKYADN